MLELKTPLQDCIEYKSKIISQICQSQEVIGLLADDPNIDIDSDDAYRYMDECIYDFNYVDKTIERSDAFIMVDADLYMPTSGSVNVWDVYVQVTCHKSYVALDSKVFKGVKGNRCDNLVCQIDKLLNGTRLFGIGRLTLQSVATALVPDSFSSKLLTYRVEEFRRER